MPSASRTPPLAGLRLPLHAIALGFLGLFLATFVVRNAPLQWDFETFLLAARAAIAGLDPYRLESLTTVAGRPISLPFVYPPMSLVPFSNFLALSAGAASVCWIVAKSVLLVGLVALWRRWFLPSVELMPIALVAVFGWNGAALWDLRAGNVALVETALLWSGFACFVAGRRAAFATLVLIAASFKLVPAVFLLLLLVPTGNAKPDGRRFWIAVGAQLALVAGPFLFPPANQWAGFLHQLPDAAGLGEANPSAFGFATVLLRGAGVPDPFALRVAALVWVAYVGLVLAVSGPLVREAWRRRDPVRWVMIAVFLDLLLSPRPMAYGYVLLVPAPFYFAPRPFTGATGRLLLAVVLSVQGLARLANREPDSLIVSYASFLLTLSLWMLIARTGTRATEVGATTAAMAPAPATT
jgi:hypothetical protein